MSTKRTLNVGLVGCGFMGRAYSNAFAKVNQATLFPIRPGRRRQNRGSG